MRRAVFAAAVLCLVAGCGSEEETTPTSAPATTASAAEPTTEIFGEYERDVTQADIDEKGEQQDRAEGWTPPPSGKWRLTLSEGSMIATDPDAGSIAQEASVANGTLSIGRYIGSKGIAFCADDAPASYAVKAEGDELVLSPENEACGDREAILAGTWTRSSAG